MNGPQRRTSTRGQVVGNRRQAVSLAAGREQPKGNIMDGPIKLTSTRVVDNRRQIYISPEAERIISNLQPRSVDVVAVVGPIRKGKSHFANLLCQRKSGFPLGDEMDSKTRDFWFWIGPHPIHTYRYLMVVDTEGLGDCSDEEQKDKDMKHLVLATLLSNHLVFNLQGNPDNTLLSNLSLMGDLAERIRVQKGENEDGNNLGDHLPELWVVLQDAHLKLPKRNGRRPEPDEYFSEVLLGHKNGHTKAIRSHNEMTDAVKAFFPNRHLRLIPAPSVDPDVLRNLDKVTDNKVEKKYKDAVDNFTREIWNSGNVKRVNGDDVKTTGFLHILRYCVDAINDPDAIPSVIGAHEAMVEGECRRASNECMKQFQETVEETVKPLIPMDEETCNRNIKTAAESAVFKLSADVGKWDKDGTWKKCLQEKLEKERLALLKANNSLSKDLCEKIMTEADQTVLQKVESGDYTTIGGYDTYTTDMEDVYRTYKEKASGKGPAVEKVLETFRAKETTRRNTIKHAARKAEEDDRRVKEERKKREEAEKARERADNRLERVAQGGAAYQGRGTTVTDVADKALTVAEKALTVVALGFYAVAKTAEGISHVAEAISKASQK